jgi:hypothetical protein
MAIERSTARREQWIGATQRAHHWQMLLARPRGRAGAAHERSRRVIARARGLVWMLAISATGSWRLRM